MYIYVILKLSLDYKYTILISEKKMFRCIMNTPGCIPYIECTYHQDSCDFYTTHENNLKYYCECMKYPDKHLYCSCGGRFIDICKCVWLANVLEPINAIIDIQEQMLADVLASKHKGEMDRRRLKGFVLEHTALLIERRPDNVDEILWADFIIPMFLLQFRRKFKPHLMLLGFEFHTMTRNGRISWLFENPFMYKEQIDQQQVYDIYSGRKEMTLEDRMLQKWMMHVPIQTTEEDINKRIHVNEGLRTNVKKMRMV